jgi:flagellar biosynthesis/type III secretory pathway protein FliH
MFKPADVTRLRPVQRGYLMGYRAAYRKANAALQRMVADLDAELASMCDEIRREREQDRAIAQAMTERAATMGAWLH